MKTKKITQIIKVEGLSDFQCNYEQLNALYLLKRYYDKVVAFKITEAHCNILIKGKLKFFCFFITPEVKMVVRTTEKKLLQIYEQGEKPVIFDKELYKLFKQRMFWDEL